jgi:pilus assembly protein Flp/PilA
MLGERGYTPKCLQIAETKQREQPHIINLLSAIIKENNMYLPREEGQGLVEYALILVLVAVVVIGILTVLGPQIGSVFSAITGGFTGT